MYAPRTTLPATPKDSPSLLRWAVDFPSWVMTELRNIAAEFAAPKDAIVLKTLHVTPSKIFAGMLVIADGTDWDPGSGAGLYRRDEANSVWHFIG